MKKVKKTRLITLIVIAILIISFFCLPKYARRALIHLYPNIDDLHLFPSNTVVANNHQEVRYDKNYNTATLETNDRREFEDLKTTAFLVMKDGRLLYEEYWGKYNDTSLSNIFSASKSIISLLIGIAIDKDYIGSTLDAISMYIPELGKEYDHITIEHLLTMSSGLDWDESYKSLFSTTTEAYYGTDLVGLILKQKPAAPAGREFYYSSGTTALLGLILKNATNMTISEFASKYLWTPIGAEHDAKWSLDKKDGMEKSYCCFYSNARDLARIGQLILQDGLWNGKRVISKEYLDKVFTPADYLTDKDGYKVNYYGYQWWLLKYKYYNIKYARGIGGQYIIVVPELNMVVVRLGEKRDDVYIGAHPKDVFLYVNTAASFVKSK
jgi:CubicO group peptidase (beta-lactamase class C family)